jgi:ubiquilin
MREAMRSQDLAMSQLENLPGGFNAMRRMYEDVQEPMMQASSSFPAPGGSYSSPSSAPTSAPSNPNTAALPNPWGGAPPAAANPFGAGLPGQNMFGSGFGASPFGIPGVGTGGGMPPMGGIDPTQMAGMMQNPQMQQMMQQMLSNPAMLQQVMSFCKSIIIVKGQ